MHETPELIHASKKKIAGAVALWAVRQSPYSVPDHLEHVLRLVQARLPDDRFPTMGYGTFAAQELYDMIREALSGIPEFNAWNERKNGREGHAFVSRMGGPAPDDDFIDLEALYRNVVATIAEQDA